MVNYEDVIKLTYIYIYIYMSGPNNELTYILFIIIRYWQSGNIEKGETVVDDSTYQSGKCNRLHSELLGTKVKLSIQEEVWQ